MEHPRQHREIIEPRRHIRPDEIIGVDEVEGVTVQIKDREHTCLYAALDAEAAGVCLADERDGFAEANRRGVAKMHAIADAVIVVAGIKMRPARIRQQRLEQSAGRKKK